MSQSQRRSAAIGIGYLAIAIIGQHRTNQPPSNVGSRGTKRTMNFLTAHWEHLILANYRVDPHLLENFVPSGTRIDFHDSVTYVSLVAFLFRNTRVLGISVPGHRDFEEVNLRFYVVPKHAPQQRAVTFLSEIVPKSVIPWVANSLFHENYVAMPMSHTLDRSRFEVSWFLPNSKSRGGNSTLTNSSSQPILREHSFGVRVPTNLALPDEGSLAQFITEHYWGYAKAPRYTLEYQVHHPSWACCEVEDYDIQIDFGASYGQAFAFLQDRRPDQVLYAAGSDVGVSFPRRRYWSP
ncbi:MAG: DUF2071 domain-containing protein [Planctomycetota bacterium]